MSYWEWFFKSFYNRKAIAYSRFRPITTTIGYVLFIIFLASIPYFISLNSSIITSINQLNRTLQHDLPNFHVSEGNLSWDGEEAFFAEEFNEGFFLIDPSNTFSETDLIQLDEGIALQQSEFIFVSDGQTHSVSYVLLGLQELSKEELSNRISQLQNFLPILLIIITSLLYVGLAGLGFLGISILAYCSLLIKGKRRLEYRHLWSITAHALTLPVIVLYWTDVLVIRIPFLAFVASTFLIVLLAVQSIPSIKAQKQ
ncbi:DUF1189 domain-containing protein [Alkalihalobacillus sp. MEB130]|uniref:DUF1189 domain-containing protein n=1 Tax=Alkalihalobacillus sp. MEB130 TaxID=2976704 RepID=UPI0028E0316B|nr:DUF1189 domain-containing protein [Alkalihalobacillus sp. MEB130]MDT8861743.1 DUF1189 domain-containing protein [Alkalihalobacillus sp. MEB130]